MAGLRELRNRLKSIRTSGQFAGAMRTVASVKYSRLNAAFSAYGAYAAECEKMLDMAGYDGEDDTQQRRDKPACLVLMSGNRGFCGGYNAELFNYFHKYCKEQPREPLIVTCGTKAAAYCTEKKIKIERKFAFSDVPTYESVHALSAYVRGLYDSGAVSGVMFVYQSLVNMLTQAPTVKQILPIVRNTPQESKGSEVLCLPDEGMVREQVIGICFSARMYSIALECAAGTQAATLVAMRSACDNAQKAEAELETVINRRRQAEVTASVLEMSSDNFS